MWQGMKALRTRQGLVGEGALHILLRSLGFIGWVLHGGSKQSERHFKSYALVAAQRATLREEEGTERSREQKSVAKARHEGMGV